MLNVRLYTEDEMRHILDLALANMVKVLSRKGDNAASASALIGVMVCSEFEKELVKFKEDKQGGSNG